MKTTTSFTHPSSFEPVLFSSKNYEPSSTKGTENLTHFGLHNTLMTTSRLRSEIFGDLGHPYR